MHGASFQPMATFCIACNAWQPVSLKAPALTERGFASLAPAAHQKPQLLGTESAVLAGMLVALRKVRQRPLRMSLRNSQANIEAAIGLGAVLPKMALQVPAAVASATVVDCGSGSTRAISFQDDFTGLSWEKSVWRGEALAAAMQDELRLEALLCVLAEQIPVGPVLVGATAGVRQALDNGTITCSQLTTFRERLLSRLGSRATFAVLSAEQEARSEWEAAQHVLSKQSAKPCDGMLSGGGMSCQLVVKDADPSKVARTFSLCNGVLAPGGLVDYAGRQELHAKDLLQGLKDVEVQTVRQLQSMPKGLRGTFTLVEWVGFYVGGSTTERDMALGLGFYKCLTRAEVLQALNQRLVELKAVASAGEAVSRRETVTLVYGTVIREILLRAFSEEASFVCLQGVHWATGHYLLCRKKILEKA
mmetsp:Transcript_26538/g.47964  ORF Transcript_26538/g.47964 Transcript_26538/m.47964 type:complete len:419 (+) Transcript_26538:63-1319(+)